LKIQKKKSEQHAALIVLSLRKGSDATLALKMRPSPFRFKIFVTFFLSIWRFKNIMSASDFCEFLSQVNDVR